MRSKPQTTWHAAADSDLSGHFTEVPVYVLRKQLLIQETDYLYD